MIENTSSARKYYEDEFDYPIQQPGKVLTFNEYALQKRAKARRFKRALERYEAMYTLFAVYPERLSAICMVFYFALRFTLYHSVPLSAYHGPLIILLPISYILIAVSYIAAHTLREPIPDEE